MPRLPDSADLEALKAFDTPTICNALELVVPARRATGFTRRPLIAAFPEMKPVVAFARTAIIRSREPHPRGREEAKEVRLGYYGHIAAEPLPSIAVIQDIDAPDTGFGAFWGEVQTHVHKGLGCAGVVTDGSVRDLEASVAGMTVSPNDVIHADRHGAIVIPPEAVKEIPAAVALIARREKVIIDASKTPGFSVARLRQAFDEVEDIH